jgi:hypothetical protein
LKAVQAATAVRQRRVAVPTRPKPAISIAPGGGFGDDGLDDPHIVEEGAEAVVDPALKPQAHRSGLDGPELEKAACEIGTAGHILCAAKGWNIGTSAQEAEPQRGARKRWLSRYLWRK